MSREIMQQALDAMERYQVKSGDFDRFVDEIAALRQELAKPEKTVGQCGCGANLYVDENGKPCSKLDLPKQEFYPDWDMLKPFHERIAELEAQLAKLDVTLIDEGKTESQVCCGDYEQCWKACTQRGRWLAEKELAKPEQEPRKEWVGLTSEDWENTPDTGKQGCERDAELFDWIEQTLKDKNEPSR